MRVPLTPQGSADRVLARLDADRVAALLHLGSAPEGATEGRLARARASVYARVLNDIERYGLELAIARAAAAYRLVPVVPPRLLGRHPAARGRGEAFERVFAAAGVDRIDVERLRRLRPRYVDDPQAAS